MQIYQSPDFTSALKDLTKPKYANTYGTVKKEIDNFFAEYATFNQVWTKNYMLYENSFVKINKVRLENEAQNSGKSGGFRLIILCDSRTREIGLLYIYPKVGPKGKVSVNLNFSKMLVKNYLAAKKSGLLKKYEFG